jgi:hypothetical protein
MPGSNQPGTPAQDKPAPAPAPDKPDAEAGVGLEDPRFLSPGPASDAPAPGAPQRPGLPADPRGVEP